MFIAVYTSTVVISSYMYINDNISITADAFYMAVDKL